MGDATKRCSKCGIEKPLEAFSLQGKRRPGQRRTRCKDCCREALREWRDTSSAHVLYLDAHRDDQKARSTKHYLANRERIIAREKARRDANPELARLRRHLEYERHRETRLAAMRVYYQDHRDEYVARAKAWADANPQRRREIVRLWYATPRGKLCRRETMGRRRARLLALPNERVDYMTVFVRDDGICGICRGAVDPDDWHLDHVIPVAAGGSHTYDNVQVAHPRCNLRKGARI